MGCEMGGEGGEDNALCKAQRFRSESDPFPSLVPGGGGRRRECLVLVLTDPVADPEIFVVADCNCMSYYCVVLLWASNRNTC